MGTMGMSGSGFQERYQRGILDSKVWDGLKTLDTDKVGFKEWTVKLRNKYCQVRTGELTRTAWDEMDRLVIWSSTIMGGPLGEEVKYENLGKDFSEELYSVILDKDGRRNSQASNGMLSPTEGQ